MNQRQGIRCAAYCRYSTYLQRDTSIEDQIRADQGLADSRKWELLADHIYIDRCTSGTKNERKGLDDLLKMAKSGNAPFQYILVYDTSRFARTPHKALLEANELAYYGKYVYFVRQGIDTADKNSTAQLGLHGIIDHQYIEQLSDSTKRGVKGQILRGYSGGGSTFGYKSSPDLSSGTRNERPLGYKLEIEKIAARTIKVIFQLYGLLGWSIIGIANYLNKSFQGKGIHKPLKGDRWRVSTVSGILRNKKYIGISVWNKTSKLKNYITSKEKVVTNPRDEWVRTESEELRIISNELWERVQLRLAEHNKKANHKYVETKKLFSKHLLTPVTKCGLCNNSFAIVSGGKYANYGCSANHHSGSSSCTNSHKISNLILERSVLTSLRENILHAESLRFRLEEIHKSLAQYILDELNRDTKAKLTEAEEENSNLIDTLKRGEKIGIKPETLLFELSQNEIRRKQLGNLLTKERCLDADIEKLITGEDLRSYFEQTLAGLGDSVKSIQSLQDLVKCINVYPKENDQVEVEITENIDKISSYIINLAAERARTAGSTRITTGTRYVSCTTRIFRFTLDAHRRQKRISLANEIPSNAVVVEIPEPLRVQEIATTLIDSNPERLRKSHDEQSLSDLAESIKSAGILAPLIVKKNSDRFTIMAGERRYSAAKIANRTTIPCIVKESEDFELISLIENIQRQDLDTIEECIAVKKLADKGLRVVEVARILGKSHTYVSKAVKIAGFAERHGEIDKLSGAAMADGRKLGLEHLLHIASQPTLELSSVLLGEIRGKSITIPALRAMKKPPEPQRSDFHRRLFLTRGRFDLSFLQSVQHSEVDEACLKELELIQIALTEAQQIVEGLLLRCRKVNKPVPAEHKLLREGPIET